MTLDTLLADVGGSAIALQESTFVEPTIVRDDIGRVDSGFVTDPKVRGFLSDTLALEWSTIADFLHVNVRRSANCAALTTRRPWFTFRMADFRTLKIADRQYFDWHSFRVAHPGTVLVTASRVGFSSDGRQALITVSEACGTMCASGWIFTLARDDRGEWRIRRHYMLWVS